MSILNIALIVCQAALIAVACYGFLVFILAM
jgi:hypothetical protein